MREVLALLAAVTVGTVRLQQHVVHEGGQIVILLRLLQIECGELPRLLPRLPAIAGVDASGEILIARLPGRPVARAHVVEICCTMQAALDAEAKVRWDSGRQGALRHRPLWYGLLPGIPP